MTDLRTAAQQALEALEEINKLSIGENAICLPAEIDGAIDALRAALAEPVQQGCDHCNHPLYAAVKCRVCGRVTEPVQEPVAFAHINGTSDTKWHPPQRKPLTEEEIAILAKKHNGIFYDCDIEFARAIERAHGIGEQQ